MQHVSISSSSCKTWLLIAEKSREAIIVDPVLDQIPGYLRLFDERKLRLSRIIDTHTHADHVSGGTVLKESAGVPYTMHQATGVTTVDARVREGDTIDLGGERIRVLHTPGHTKDSLALVTDRLLMTGDFLFLGEGGAGRTDLVGGDPGEHWDSLQKLSALPDHLVVLPGHDYRGLESGRLGDERRRNPRLLSKSKEDYVRWLGGMSLEPAEWMLDVLKANAGGAKTAVGLRIPEGACCEVGGGASRAGTDFATVGVDVLAKRLGEIPRSFLVLDVRELAEYTGPLGHVPGALHLSIRELERRLPELEAHRNREIFIICLSGGRSAGAADMMQEAGFSKPINVAGGMRAWAMSDFPREFGAANEPMTPANH